MAQGIDLDALYDRAFELRCAGRYAESRMELQRILTVDPRHLKGRHLLGLIQGFEGDFDGSCASLASLVAEAPTNVGIRYDLAMTQMMIGMIDEAAANFREILRLQPNHEDAKKQLAYF